MKIKTEVFQEMIAKAIKGASFNKMIPITGFVTIEKNTENLILRTTDGMNKVRVIIEEKSKETLLTTVRADVLASLVSKTTSEFIELKEEENYLVVKGNGEYKLDVPLDEDAELVQIKEEEMKLRKQDKPIKITSAKEFKEVLKTHKASISETMEVPCLVGYYFNDKVITTNRFLVTVTNKNFFNQAILIPSSLIELVFLFQDDESITVTIIDNKIIFASEKLSVTGYLMEEIGDYPVESVQRILVNKFDYSVNLNKKSLLQAVDRLTLFVDPFDRNGLFLNFIMNEVIVSNKKSSGVENVVYEKQNKKEINFTCLADVEFLVSQLNAYPEDTVEVNFGSKVLLQFKSENVIQMIALLTLEE